MSDKTLIYFDKALTGTGIVAFVVLEVLAFLQDPCLCLRITLVCTISFVIVTLLRKFLNFPRPDYEGAIYDKKKGEAFPSRHTFSLAIIALSWLNINVIAGSVLFGLSILLGGVRIAIGAHSPKDVYCAIIIALVVAYAGYMFF